MKLYIVKSQETDLSKNGIVEGQQKNAQLNEYGVKQAEKLKTKLKNINFDLCFTSPLINAWSTAIILVGDKLLIEEDKRLIERSYGELENKLMNECNLEEYWKYEKNLSKNKVEPIQDAIKRCKNLLDDLKDKYNDKILLLITHESIIRAFNHIIGNRKISSNIEKLQIEDNKIFEYEI